MNFLILFLTSSLTTYLLMRLACFLFPKWGLMDRPKDYGLKRNPIPYSVGIIIFLVFAAHLLLYFQLSKELVGVILAGGLLAFFSMADDFKRYKAHTKLFVQIITALIIITSGVGIEVITHPFGGAIDLEMWQIPLDLWGTTYHITPLADIFTLVWILAVMNAVNFLDGIPGLVSGMGTIASLTVFLLSVLLMTAAFTTPMEKIDAQLIAELSIILFGILLIFNRFDFFPNKVVIGDSGAIFIGYLLAVLSILAGGKVATTFIVLGLPLADMIWVIVRRMTKGQHPFQGDTNHYHHKLLRIGLTERQSLYFMYFCTALLGLLSLVFLFYLKSFGKFIVIAMVTLLIFMTSYLLIQKETKELKKT